MPNSSPTDSELYDQLAEIRQKAGVDPPPVPNVESINSTRFDIERKVKAALDAGYSPQEIHAALHTEPNQTQLMHAIGLAHQQASPDYTRGAAKASVNPGVMTQDEPKVDPNVVPNPLEAARYFVTGLYHNLQKGGEFQLQQFEEGKKTPWSLMAPDQKRAQLEAASTMVFPTGLGGAIEGAGRAAEVAATEPKPMPTGGAIEGPTPRLALPTPADYIAPGAKPPSVIHAGASPSADIVLYPEEATPEAINKIAKVMAENKEKLPPGAVATGLTAKGEVKVTQSPIKAMEEVAKKKSTPKISPPISDLKDYSESLVKGGRVKSVTLVGSTAAKGAGQDVDLVYDFGDLKLPADSDMASTKVEDAIEAAKGINLDKFDSFIKADGRYFYVASGAGRGVVENTEYGLEQAGRPKIHLAGKAEEAPTEIIEGRGVGRPRVRQFLPSQSDERIKAAAARFGIDTKQDIGAVRQQVDERLKKIRMAQEGRKGAGRPVEGKGGRKIVTVPLTEDVEKAQIRKKTGMRGARKVDEGVGAGLEDLRVASAPPPTPAQTFSSLKKVADEKGFDLSMEQGPNNTLTYNLVGPGGRKVIAKSLDEVQGFVDSKMAMPRQPIEIKTEGGTSTFEKMVNGDNLGEADKAALARQAEKIKAADPLDPEPPEEDPYPPEKERLFYTTRLERYMNEERKNTPPGAYAKLIKKYMTELGMSEDQAIISADKVLNLSEKGRALDRIAKEWRASKVKPPEPPEEDLGPPMGGGAEDRIKLVSPDTQPQLVNSWVIRKLGQATDKARAAMQFELGGKDGKGGMRRLYDQLSKLLPTTELRKQAMQQVEGKIRSTNRAVIASANAYRRIMADLATRAGIPADQFYATHLTDFDAIYSAFKTRFATVWVPSDLDVQLQMKIRSAGELNKIKKIFDKFPDWGSMPKATKSQLMDLWDFSRSFSTWEALPSFLKTKLPKDRFNQYFIPRTGAEVPYVEDLLDAFRQYVPKTVRSIHYDPVIQQFKPIVDALPDKGMSPESTAGSWTEKGYAVNYMMKELYGRPGDTDRLISALSDQVHESLGVKLADRGTMQIFATGLRSAMYRGMLGLSGAVAHATQAVFSWAETGRIVKPLFKYVVAQADRVPGIKGLSKNADIAAYQEARPLFGRYSSVLEEGYGIPKGWSQEKFLKVNQLIDDVVFSPYAVSESIDRGNAFFAGMEEAAKKGMSSDKMLVNALARASNVVPNLELSEQAQYALYEHMPKVGSPMNSAQRSPFFRGPLGRLTTMLTSFPSRSTHLMYNAGKEGVQEITAQIRANGIAQGFVKGFKTDQGAKLLRYIATAGFFAYGPTLIGKMTGYRPRWGFVREMADLSFPFWHAIGNAYNAGLGRNALTKHEARRQLEQTLEQIIFPGRSYYETAKKAVKNVNEGYSMDSLGRDLYQTTKFGELMRAFGFTPEKEVEGMKLKQDIIGRALEYTDDKREAVDGMINGDATAAQGFMKKYGRPITMEDLVREQRYRQMSPEQRAEQRLPRALRGE